MSLAEHHTMPAMHCSTYLLTDVHAHSTYMDIRSKYRDLQTKYIQREREGERERGRERYRQICTDRKLHYICVHVCMYERMNVCMYVCSMYVCMSVSV